MECTLYRKDVYVRDDTGVVCCAMTPKERTEHKCRKDLCDVGIQNGIRELSLCYPLL